MIAFIACLGALTVVLGALHFLFVRPLQQKLAELEKNFGAHSVWSTGQHRLRRDEIRVLRSLSGEEICAVSERLDRVESERITTPCQS
jgi:hypothetical protein